MHSLFSVRDVRQRTDELCKDAEDGRLTLITRHGEV